MRDERVAWINRLCEIDCPRAGRLIVFYEAYFDESCTNKSDFVQGFSGYVIESNDAIAMTKEWLSVLSEYGLEYFHTVECAQNSKQFQKYRNTKDRETPDIIARKMIDLIKKYVAHGFSVLYNPKLYEGASINDGLDIVQYASAVQFAVQMLLLDAKHTSAEVSGIRFIFEAGHASESVASREIDKYISRITAEDRNAFSGFTFANKRESPLLQAADMIAWQSTKYIKNFVGGRPLRKDFESLLEVPTRIQHMETSIRDVGESMTTYYADNPKEGSDFKSATLNRIYRQQERHCLQLFEVDGTPSTPSPNGFLRFLRF